MALIECSECKRQISSDAKKCPQCGAKQKKPTSLFTWVVGGVLGAGMIAGIVHSNNAEQTRAAEEAQRVANLTPEQRAREARDKAQLEVIHTAQSACEDFVLKSLHDPSGADLDRFSQYPAKEIKPSVFLVQVTGKAKNGFNATRQLTANCTVSRGADGGWTLVSLKELR